MGDQLNTQVSTQVSEEEKVEWTQSQGLHEREHRPRHATTGGLVKNTDFKSLKNKQKSLSG